MRKLFDFSSERAWIAIFLAGNVVAVTCTHPGMRDWILPTAAILLWAGLLRSMTNRQHLVGMIEQKWRTSEELIEESMEAIQSLPERLEKFENQMIYDLIAQEEEYGAEIIKLRQERVAMMNSMISENGLRPRIPARVEDLNVSTMSEENLTQEKSEKATAEIRIKWLTLVAETESELRKRWAAVAIEMRAILNKSK